MTSIHASLSLPPDLRGASPDPDPTTGPSRTLVVCGTRRSLLRIGEDVARAVGMRMQEASPERAEHLLARPVRPGDALLVDVEALPGPRTTGGPGPGRSDSDDLSADRAGQSSSQRRGGSPDDPVPEDAAPLFPAAGAFEGAGPVVLAGFTGSRDPWEAAAELSARGLRTDVVMLPAGRGWLADHLAGTGEQKSPRPLIGVLGACGGLGTSSVALWLGAQLLERGEDAVVIDAVEGSCGLDSCISGDRTPGLRWEELDSLPHLPEAGRILTTLPAPHGLPVLSSGVGATSGPTGHERVSRSLTAAVLRAVAVPVADLGSWDGGGTGTETADGASRAEEWIGQLSALVLLVPFSLRGLCQARAAAEYWSARIPVHAVGAGPRLLDVSDAEAGEAVGLPLTAVLPPVRAVYEAAENGYLLEIGHRRALREPVARILDAVLPARAEGSGGRRSPSGTGRTTSRIASEQFASVAGARASGTRSHAGRGFGSRTAGRGARS